MKKILFCFGTRPEVTKLAPVILEAKERGIQPILCCTGQHREMLIPFLEFFDLKVDVNLDIMKPGQGLSYITSAILTHMEEVLNQYQPDLVMVQGDTSTTFTCALAAFYHRKPVAHLEAGLRTNNKYSPFPEEINRRLVSPIADYHFPPTEFAASNLKKEGVTSNVIVTGNTSLDAIRYTSERLSTDNLWGGLYSTVVRRDLAPLSTRCMQN